MLSNWKCVHYVVSGAEIIECLHCRLVPVQGRGGEAISKVSLNRRCQRGERSNRETGLAADQLGGLGDERLCTEPEEPWRENQADYPGTSCQLKRVSLGVNIYWGKSERDN